MRIQSKIIIGALLWFLMSIVAYGSIAFMTLSLTPVGWPWYIRAFIVALEVVLLPLLSSSMVEEINKQVLIDSNPDMVHGFERGVEAMRKAVLQAKPDCEVGRGIRVVESLKVPLELT